MTAEKPAILILGAGAVGLALAGKLADAADVYAVCRERHAQAVRAGGLVMDGVWGDRTIRTITCYTGPEEAAVEPDFVFITAKATGTRRICREYAAILEGRPVISLQNGIGNEEIIGEFSDSVIGGTITTNFSITAPGHVRVKSQSAPVRLGVYPLPGGDERREALTHRALRRLLAILGAAGIAAEESGAIRSDIWAKSLLNIAVNPIRALLAVPVGALSDPFLWEIIGGLVRESFAVAGAAGIRLPWDDADSYLAYLHDVQIPDFAGAYTSMYHDIRESRPTEIDLLNGFVVRRGEDLGIPTPYNRCITNLIRFRQERNHPQGTRSSQSS